tara:strand:- start:129 stop:452 length:324 start_codon:yes stop_codon:yes gene_type:complete
MEKEIQEISQEIYEVGNYAENARHAAYEASEKARSAESYIEELEESIERAQRNLDQLKDNTYVDASVPLLRLGNALMIASIPMVDKQVKAYRKTRDALKIIGLMSKP